MIRTTIAITGLQRVLDEVQALSLARVRPVVEAAIEAIARDAATYPAQPPGSTYVRTGDLGRGWQGEPQINLGGDTLAASLVNDTPYGPYVQGPEDQARIHRDRWRTTDDLVATWEPRLAADIEAALLP